MKVISVNVGKKDQISWRGNSVSTGIFKVPVMGVVHAAKLGLDGDVQIDRTVHGGLDRAVYVYPSEHYELWRSELPSGTLERFGYGAFGENLTIEGLMEDEVCVGDELIIGSARFLVKSPRIACYKLATKLGVGDMPKRFGASGRSGFYLSVEEEGELSMGNAIAFGARADDTISIADLNRLLTTDSHNHTLLEAALASFDLSKDTRDYLVSTQGT